MAELFLSIADTNKIRAKLGLKLIPDPEKTPQIEVPKPRLTLKATNKLRSSLGLKTQDEALFYKTVDSKNWLNNVGKKAREKTGTEEKAIEGNNQLRGAAAETPDVHIPHSSEEMAQVKDGEVLVLQDQNVLDEGTVLSNAKLREMSRDKKRELEEKKRDQRKYGLQFEEGELNEKTAVTVSGDTVYLEADKPLDAPSATHVPQKRKMKKIKKKSTNQRARHLDDEIKVQSMVTRPLEFDEPEEGFHATIAKRKRPLSAAEIAAEVERHRIIDETSRIEGRVLDDTSTFLAQVDKKIAEVKGRESTTIQDTLETRSSVKAANADDKVETNEADNKGPQDIVDASEDNGEEKAFSISSVLKKHRTNQPTDKPRRELAKEGELQKLRVSIELRIVREELEQDAGFLNLSKEEQQQLHEQLLHRRLLDKGIVHLADSHVLYTPDMRLKYTNRKGEELSTKAAWKQLSREFHAKAAKRRGGR